MDTSYKLLSGKAEGFDLGESIRVKKSKNQVIVYSDKVYAQIHNEGGTITVTEKMKRYFWAKYKETKEEVWKGMALKKVGSVVTIPKRQFMGESATLNKAIDDKVSRQLAKIVNKN